MSADDPPRGRLGQFFAAALALAVQAVFAALAFGGLLILYAVVRDWRTGDMETGDTAVLGFFGILMTLIGAGFLWLAHVGAPGFLRRLERRRAKYRDRPWLVDRRWRARRVVHSTGYAVWFMWFWCLVWWGIIGFFWSVNGESIKADLRGSWIQAVPASIPFVAGVLGLLVAVGLTWHRWRHGDAVLLIDTLPGYLGERFSGRVQAQLAAAPRRPITIALACVSRRKERRISSGGTMTEWVDDELWSTRHDLGPTQTTFDRGRITLPVSFDLPSGLPESGDILDEPQIVWKLTVSGGSTRGGLARCAFDVPVYRGRGQP